jgi:uncharacterized membrane protein
MLQPRMHWYEVWWLALIKPSVATFEAISLLYDSIDEAYQDHADSLTGLASIMRERNKLMQFTMGPVKTSSLKRTLLQQQITQSVMYTSAIGMILTLAGVALLALAKGENLSPSSAPAPSWLGSAVVQLVCTFGLAGLMWSGIAMVGFRIVTTIRAVLAQMLGGGKQFVRFAYVSAAYHAPLALVTGILRPIPGIGWYVMGVRAVYGLILSALVIRAVYKFPWWKVILINLPYMIGAILVTVAVSPVGGQIINDWMMQQSNAVP